MTSYYPKLSLVSKSFRSLIFSNDLGNVRYHFKTKEKCVFLRLKLSTRYHPCWFSLWINKETGKKLLVPAPSSYTPHLPIFYRTVGLELYLFFDGRRHDPSSVLWVTDKRNNHKNWVKTLSMMVVRVNTLVMKDLHEKIYVLGGCKPDESTNWAEVFDTKTRTWESLPDPGVDLCFTSIKKIEVEKYSLYVISNKKHYVYHPKQRRWDVTKTHLSVSMCRIDNVLYCVHNNNCLWLDVKLGLFKSVKGLDMLGMYDKKDSVEIAYYGGKLIMFWNSPYNEIWCEVIIDMR